MQQKRIFLRFYFDCTLQIQEHHFPAQVNMEQVRIKKYEPNNKDEFKNHVDVGSYASARRFLVFFFNLLNDNFRDSPPFTHSFL